MQELKAEARGTSGPSAGGYLSAPQQLPLTLAHLLYRHTDRGHWKQKKAGQHVVGSPHDAFGLMNHFGPCIFSLCRS
jgi:hypothetical protein